MSEKIREITYFNNRNIYFIKYWERYINGAPEMPATYTFHKLFPHNSKTLTRWKNHFHWYLTIMQGGISER